MAKKRLKPLLPSLREKKRYIAYEIISKEKFDAIEANKAIVDAAKEFLGDLGMAKAGMIPMEDQWNMEKQKGIIRVNNKHTDHLRASMLFVKSIKGKEVIIRSLGASGILKKTQQLYLN